MYKKIIAGLAVLVSILLITILLIPTTVSYEQEEVAEIHPIQPPTQEILRVIPKLSHQQEVWMYALEWCESNGVPEAINEVDLDGTPSYSSWQFKPSTLWGFAKQYGIAVPDTEEGKREALMDRAYQWEVLKQMVLHRNEVNWDQQFPWCVKKLGYPPKG